MEVIGRYLELGLRLGRHVDGLVDAYYGPRDAAESVNAEPLRDPAALAADAARLSDDVASAQLEPNRARWLAAQLTGLETVSRRLAGEEIPFADEVERCYGLRPRRVSEEGFEAAHRELDRILPGRGPVAARYGAWREGSGIEGETLQRVVGALGDELRARTADTFGLPDGESVAFDYVHDEPWTAFNYYEGDLRSRVAVNLELPMPPSRVVELVAHETYPGHHTEHAWKEQRLVREGGQLEESLLMIGTPQALLSEGIAEVGFELMLGAELEELAAAQLAPEGIDYDAELARAVKRAAAPLEDVATNVALMIHEDGASHEEGRAYLVGWGLATEERATHRLRFITDPVWRSYITTYTDGHRLCEAFVDGDPARFRRLLTEQLTPAALTAAV